MAADVAKRATSATIRSGTAVSWTPAGYVTQPRADFVEIADITDADVARFVSTGRNKYYYTTGEADPPDPV